MRSAANHSAPLSRTSSAVVLATCAQTKCFSVAYTACSSPLLPPSLLLATPPLSCTPLPSPSPAPPQPLSCQPAPASPLGLLH